MRCVMFQTIITATVLYVATAVDLLVILLIYFAKANTKKEYKDIYIGQYLGSLILIIVSLFLAFVLNYVPEKWILGLLGLIPIYLGIKVAIYDDCEGEKRAKKELNNKGLSKLVGTVVLVTIASCGADNIGLFVPYFVTLNSIELLTTLLVFVTLIFILVFTAQNLANIPGIGEVVEKFSRWIMAVIYIALGVFIVIENKTISTLLSFIL
ncbi:CadD family cadmium resistance transporter [Staphylococcus lentus]|nr:CadD family cadmium resistance transporter [Mammaliicoccus lentus]MBF0795523.1 CadD family cadmium resistance transporter [Mammaliicoccus lentus]MBF0842067.1 CadD family cadmium resistance transporter [Mammaliicoccus lentus]MBW0762844.1 CadD family cadmium resistance transporter [Mammaliicoccus lentus]QMU10264.1 CadD family cadmium resistance transporter [Mammaliicoccus lentus]